MTFTSIEIWLGKLIGEKTASFLLKINWRTSNLSFYDATLTYSYSFYDEQGSHILEGGSKMIYNIRIGLTCQNTKDKPKIMRNVQLLADVNNETFTLDLIDPTKESWQSLYNIAPYQAIRFSWSAYTKGSGINNENGMIPLKPSENQMDFQICYINERNKTINIPLQKIESRKMNPRLIGK